jgi:glycosyltransferase involved in cell wall biosynthesis
VLPAAVHCAALIPCRNEAETIPKVVQGIRAHVASVFVIDDHSSDDTEIKATEAGALVICNKGVTGKGAALATGWKAAAAQGFEWVLMLDGDGQHQPEDAPRFFEPSVADIRLVVGNRMPQAHRMPWARRATNRLLSRLVSSLAGQSIPDSQCGFRLAHLQTLLSLRLASKHFEIESEMCIEFARAGHRITSTPIQTCYGAERSKISVAPDAMRWCAWYWRARRQRRHSI